MQDGRIGTITRNQNPGSVGAARGRLTMASLVELLLDQRLYLVEDSDGNGDGCVVVFDYWADDECWSYGLDEADHLLAQLDDRPADQSCTMIFHECRRFPKLPKGDQRKSPVDGPVSCVF
jgi:hypothetical protein